ncbi:MAG: class I SAM-dependent methyltransferase, partial [Ktedonobacteraceae bacterium]|nr:class I SAM-dependent methyltransferase [Ktedonobacteraceae bacterium]
MATEPHDHKELESTYFVQDRSNDSERKRLMIQDRMVTKSRGGVLPEQPDPTRFQSIIDVGCGTGGWLIDVATTYPSIPLLVGADISQHMVEFA